MKNLLKEDKNQLEVRSGETTRNATQKSENKHNCSNLVWIEQEVLALHLKISRITSATYFCMDAVGIQYESVYKQFVIETKT